jgi:hypothetical protein
MAIRLTVLAWETELRFYASAKNGRYSSSAVRIVKAHQMRIAGDKLYTFTEERLRIRQRVSTRSFHPRFECLTSRNERGINWLFTCRRRPWELSRSVYPSIICKRSHRRSLVGRLLRNRWLLCRLDMDGRLNHAMYGDEYNTVWTTITKATTLRH